MRPIRVGTRGSALAQWQANWVVQQLALAGARAELIPIKTLGDVVSKPIEKLGRSGVFTREIQRALVDGLIDVAVHSLKDLPTDRCDGLVLAAVPRRESPSDVLVSRERLALADLPFGARVGTSSARRSAQLLAHREDLVILDVRGNVDTRLQKLDAGDYDALVLAEAGLRRLNLASRITEVLPWQIMLPAVGQGALGLETRSNDAEAMGTVGQLNDEAARQAVSSERALLAALRGGCLAPIGAWARQDDLGALRLDAIVLSPDGQTRLAASGESTPHEAEELGRFVAEQLISRGANELLEAARIM